MLSMFSTTYDCENSINIIEFCKAYAGWIGNRFSIIAVEKIINSEIDWHFRKEK